MAVRIIDTKCKGCQKCVKACPFEAITMNEKLAVIGPNCTSCGACIDVCPFKAIEKVEDLKRESTLPSTTTCGSSPSSATGR